MVSLKQERQAIEWRRSKVLEMSSKGFSGADIARELQATEATISRDIKHLREQAKHKIREFIDKDLPAEYTKTLVGIKSIMKEAWIAASNAVSGKDRIQALSLAKECLAMNLELLTNASVVEDAVKFVEGKKQKEKKPEPAPSFDEDEDIIDSEEPVPAEPDQEEDEIA
jgi:predicted transcriptional regulator